jgi:hypothetical protein
VPAETADRVGTSQSSPDTDKKPTLVEGHLMRCPNCELLRDPTIAREFKRLDRNEKYVSELNVVYQCVKTTGGCGHVFSPGDQNIIRAYLAGDLVPASHLRAGK